MQNEMITRESTVLGERYHVIRHTSGLEIYVFPKKRTTAYALFATRYGAVDNSFRLSPEEEFTVVPDGIAHYLEHKMFENEDGSDAFSDFAAAGANANAFTSARTTAYLFSCTENFEQSLGTLLDMVTHPHFTDASVEKERGIIGQEIRMGEDSPGRALYYGMMRAMYRENHVRINVAGTVESIAEITPELLHRCHSVFYNLRNMALFICGDVTVEQVLAVADAHLEIAPPLSIERKEPIEPCEVAERRFIAQMQVAKPLFSIGIKDNDISSDPAERLRRQCVLDIGCEILFSGSSPLRNALYEEGLIGSSLSYGYGICDSYAYTSISGESGDPEQVYRRVFDYIRETVEQGIDPEAFERCRRVIYADCVASFDDTAEIAQSLMDFVFDGEEMFDEPRMIAEITPEEVRQTLRAVLSEEYAVMAVIEPLASDEEKNDAEEETEDTQ